MPNACCFIQGRLFHPGIAVPTSLQEGHLIRVNEPHHPPLRKPYERLEFDVPAAATAGGNLTLSWYGQPGRGGNGRGCQVAEVWLMKK